MCAWYCVCFFGVVMCSLVVVFAVYFPCSNAYTLVLHKQGRKLYSTLREVINEHLLQEVSTKI